MTDSDDLLTLQVDGDDGDDGRQDAGAPSARRVEASDTSGATGGRSTARSPVGLSGSELVTLSSEARLATALLLQAQALEGMRQAHSDLLSRLDAGGGARRSEELHSALREVQQVQQQTLGQLARARHRASQRTAMFVALLVLGALAAGWLVQSSRADVSRAVADARAELVGKAAADRADLETSLKAAMTATASQQDAMLEELVAGLRGNEAQLRDRLDRTSTERDEARAQLAGKHQEVAGLQSELVAETQGRDSMELELHKTRDERNRQIGEASRLREQLIDRDRQLEELTNTISKVRTDMEARAAAPDGRIVNSAIHPESFAGRLTTALRGSGAKEATVLEAGPVVDGALTGVLVMLGGSDSVSGRVVRAETARLLVERGMALLRLESVQEPDRETPTASLDVALPELDPAAWRALGLEAPGDFVPISKVSEALGALLSPQGYVVVRLESFDGLTLGGLELRQEDTRGTCLRTLMAATGEVRPVGPELALEGGSILVGDDARPFFQGQCRVPLPGADYGAWLAATRSDSK